MKVFTQRTFTVLVVIVIVGGVLFAFWPQPVSVEVTYVTRGMLRETVNEDGKTRIKERYVVAAPLAGRLQRINLDPGDPVEQGCTLLARIEPGDPALLDSRSLAEASAKVRATEAALNRAQPMLNRARLEMQHAEAELGRLTQLRNSHVVTPQELEDAEVLFFSRREEFRAAKFAEDIARFELEMAQAALLRSRPIEISGAPSDDADMDRILEIRSPIHGRVLRLWRESATIVAAGTELLELGDPTDLEVEVDVLSRDAVRIAPGQKVVLEQWGGNAPLAGLVRIVEPAGFTKVSALGVEEQRVNVIVDLADPPQQRLALGDGYRVEATVIVWEGNVLKVPTSALFRQQSEWAVFVVDNTARARLKKITIGHRSGLEAEVVSGLEEHEKVIVHPHDQISDGVAVVER